MLHTKFVTLKRCGSNGSTQATTPWPLIREYAKSS
jgi:hypothetical protein